MIQTGTFSKKRTGKDKAAKLKQSSKGSAPELLRRGALTKADISVAVPKLDKSGKPKWSSSGSAPQLLRRGTFTKADIGMAVPVAPGHGTGAATEYLEIAGKGTGAATEYLEIAGKGTGAATEYLEIADTTADVAAAAHEDTRAADAPADGGRSTCTPTPSGDTTVPAAEPTSGTNHTTQGTYATSSTPIRRTKRGRSSSSAAINRAVHRTALMPITENGPHSADPNATAEQVLHKTCNEEPKQFVLPRHCTGFGTAPTERASRGNRKFSIVERAAGNPVVTL